MTKDKYKIEFLNKQKEELKNLLINYENKEIRLTQIEKLKIFSFMNTHKLNALIQNLDLFKNEEQANKIMKYEILKNIRELECE